MARNGYRIFDSDTHVGPYMDVLERYLSSEEKTKLAPWEPFKSKNTERVVYTKGQRRYLRKLGTAAAEPDKGAYMAGFTGAKKSREPAARGDHDPAERIKDLDYEGVDVNLTLPSGWFGTWTAGEDVALEKKPSEYVMSGRYFQSIEIPEGDKLTNAVIDLVGEDVLMYASDYPHGESHFPKSVEKVLAWDMPERRKKKLFWDNAVRLYARCGLH